jgi:Type II secretion system (T2SS), protein G
MRKFREERETRWHHSDPVIFAMNHFWVLPTMLLLGLVATLFMRPRPGDRWPLPTVARDEVCEILGSLNEYRISHSETYPNSLQALVTRDADGHCSLEGFDGKLPLDPWNHEYLYEAPTVEHPKPHVWTYGADGKRGGIGEDADIDGDRLADNP